jgi:hypothetical protein
MAEPSHVQFWIPGAVQDGADATSGTKGFLSYNIFLALSVVGGFFALDHLYLRSPKTFIAKLLVNMMFFGAWWAWDICQAVFNKAVVRLYGLSVPFLGPKGIGAGALAADDYDSEHWRFFAYGAALAFGGMFGLDSFLVEDNQVGLFRLLMSLTVIFAPISLAIWVYKVFTLVCYTSEVRDQYPNYFSGKGGSNGFPGIFDWIFGKEFMRSVASALNIVDKMKDVLGDLAGMLPATHIWKGVTAEALTKAQESKKPEADAPTVNAAQAPANPVNVKRGGKHNDESNDIKLLPYTLVGTIALIFGSGIYKNFTKTISKKDDSPPEPR